MKTAECLSVLKYSCTLVVLLTCGISSHAEPLEVGIDAEEAKFEKRVNAAVRNLDEEVIYSSIETDRVEGEGMSEVYRRALKKIARNERKLVADQMLAVAASNRLAEWIFDQANNEAISFSFARKKYDIHLHYPVLSGYSTTEPDEEIRMRAVDEFNNNWAGSLPLLLALFEIARFDHSKEIRKKAFELFIGYREIFEENVKNYSAGTVVDLLKKYFDESDASITERYDEKNHGSSGSDRLHKYEETEQVVTEAPATEIPEVETQPATDVEPEATEVEEARG